MCKVVAMNQRPKALAKHEFPDLSPSIGMFCSGMGYVRDAFLTVAKTP